MTVKLSRREFLKLTGSAWITTTLSSLIIADWISAKSDNSSPTKSTNELPNVLFLVMDTVRAQSLSVYDYNRPTTPNLEQLAATGVLFDKAISPSPWTLPAHGSMFTGRQPHELSTNWLERLDNTYPTLAEKLSVLGYSTAGFVANTEYCSREFGLDRGFAYYSDYSLFPGQLLQGSTLNRTILNNHKFRKLLDNYEIIGRKNAELINHEFFNWLTTIDKQRPFFAFLNYYDAHDPYLPPEEYALKFSSKIPRGHFSPDEQLSDEDIQEMNNAYDGAIAYLDDQIGLLYRGLQEQQLLENTFLIITSDHGEQFGEHGLMGHANSLYLPALHVPLIIVSPSRVPSGRRIDQPVTLRDLPETILDVIGLGSKGQFPGDSLSRYWKTTNSISDTISAPMLSEVDFAPGQPEYFPVSKGDMKSLITNQYHYIVNGDGREEMYAYETDPLEDNDLATSSEHIKLLDEFRASLKKVLGMS